MRAQLQILNKGSHQILNNRLQSSKKQNWSEKELQIQRPPSFSFNLQDSSPQTTIKINSNNSTSKQGPKEKSLVQTTQSHKTRINTITLFSNQFYIQHKTQDFLWTPNALTLRCLVLACSNLCKKRKRTN